METPKPVAANPTVAIIDDHDIVRFGLETLILGCADLALAGSASTLSEGLALIGSHRPDLVITDMAVGDSIGLDTVRAVVAAQRPRPTIVLSMQDEMLYGEQVLALGARGYLMKEHAHASIVPAARAVLAGGSWVSPRLNTKLLNRMMQRNRNAADATARAETALTMRELEVLELLRGGHTTKEIAAALALSARTVDIHRANIKRKLGLRSGAELVAYASTKL
jgi:DNA-binding NarL/FixJ family response regulator